jgi:nitric oxide reductase subunit B
VTPPPRRPMTVSPLWLQCSVLTLIFGFAILGYAVVRTFRESAPVPSRIVDEAGRTLFDREEIVQGQEHFLTYGLMQYGTIYGHGAYLGPDFTADYLHREAVLMKDLYGGDDAAGTRVRRELQACPALTTRSAGLASHAAATPAWSARSGRRSATVRPPQAEDVAL